MGCLIRTGYGRDRLILLAPPRTGWHQLRGVLRERRAYRSLLFDPSRSVGSPQRFALPEFTDEVWHGYLPNAPVGRDLRLPAPTGRMSLSMA